MSRERRDARAKETGAPRSRQRALLVPTLFGTQLPGGPSLQLRGESARRPVLSRVRTWLCRPPSAVRGESGWPRRAPRPASPHLRSRRAPGGSGSAGSGCRLARRAQRGAPRAARAHRGLGVTSASYLMASSPSRMASSGAARLRRVGRPARLGPRAPVLRELAGSPASHPCRPGGRARVNIGRPAGANHSAAGTGEELQSGSAASSDARWVSGLLKGPAGSLWQAAWRHQPDRAAPSPI